MNYDLSVTTLAILNSYYGVRQTSENANGSIATLNGLVLA
jgi:hypothetical protein